MDASSITRVLGLGFAIAGLVHKKEWKANRRAWHKMDKKRRLLIIMHKNFW